MDLVGTFKSSYTCQKKTLRRGKVMKTPPKNYQKPVALLNRMHEHDDSTPTWFGERALKNAVEA